MSVRDAEAACDNDDDIVAYLDAGRPLRFTYVANASA